MKKNQNNYAFIDSQNLNLGIRECGWKLNFKEFRKFLADKYRVQKAYLFLGYIKENEVMYDSLRRSGYKLIFRSTLEDIEGLVKGNCDAELVLHCMIQFSNFDKAIIVSGDGDFHCLIEYLLEQKKLLKIGIPNKKGYSALLKKFSDHFLWISRYKKRLEYKKKGAISS